MNRIGAVLLWLGAVLGIVVGLGVGIVHFSPIALQRISWWVALGLTKLALAASGGLMVAGATVLRLGRREEARSLEDETVRPDAERLPPPSA